MRLGGKLVQGCNQAKFDHELSSISLQDRADGLNRLLQKSRVQLFNVDNSLVYKEITQEDAAK